MVKYGRLQFRWSVVYSSGRIFCVKSLIYLTIANYLIIKVKELPHF